jgi:hypothetical protein
MTYTKKKDGPDSLHGWLESVTKIRDEQLEILHRNLRFADETEDDKWAEISNAIAGAQALFVFKLDQLIQGDSNRVISRKK